MKDIIIKGSSIKRELVVLAGCAVAAVSLDLFAVIKYHKPFVELFQTVGYIVFVAVITYFVLGALRLAVCLATRLFRRINNK